MNGFELTVNLIDTIAWPVTTLVLAWIFRKQIGSVISALASRAHRLTKLSAPGVSAEFEADVVEAALEVETTVSSIEKAGRPSVGGGPKDHLGSLGSEVHPRLLPDRGSGSDDWRQLEQLRMIAKVAPRGALLEAHMQLERAVIALAEHRGWRRERKLVTIRDPLMFLKKDGFSGDFVANAEDLTRLRNRAAHELEMDLTADAALLYIDSVMRLIDVVELWMGPIEDYEAQPEAE